MSRAGWKTGFAGDAVTGVVGSNSEVHGYIINRIRDDIILMGGLRHRWRMELGSRQRVYFPAVADTYEDHEEYPPGDIVIDWDTLEGDGTGDSWNVNVLLEMKCENAATTATARVVLAGTSTLVVASAAVASTSWTAETLAIPASTGVKTYRLQYKRSDLVYGIRCVAVFELYSPAATP